MPKMSADLDQLLTIPEAAHELEVPERDVRELLQEGSLRGTKVGGRWVTSVAAVDELIDSLDDEDADDEDDEDGEDDEDDDDDEKDDNG